MLSKTDYTAFIESPICTLSLSSKELFHSNMIAYLFRKYPQFLYDFLGENICGETKILREKKNIDISIQTEKGLFYIENKVKSIPDKEQIQKYMDTLQDGNFILLTLMMPSFDHNSLTKPLTIITYSELITKIEKIQEKNEYLKSLISDYLILLRFLDKLEKEIVPKSLDERVFLEKEVQNELSEIRMEDIGQKIRFSAILNSIKINCKDIYDEYSADLSHSKGLIDLKVSVGNIKIGIQVQEGQYRRLVEHCDDKKSVRTSVEKMRENKIWFINEFYSEKFNKFGENFLYTKMKIDNLTISELIAMVKKDGEYIKKNLQAFEKIVGEVN